MGLTRWTGVTLVLGALCASGGCTPPKPGGHDAGSAIGDAGEAIEWPYWPAGIRVHPLTRLITDEESGRLELEARVELVDLDGDTTKGIGLLTMRLYDAGDRSRSHAIVTWRRDLADPAVNRLHYDDVTRTYLLRLELDPDRLPETPLLQATLEAPGGRTIVAGREIRTH